MTIHENNSIIQLRNYKNEANEILFLLNEKNPKTSDLAHISKFINDIETIELKLAAGKKEDLRICTTLLITMLQDYKEIASIGTELKKTTEATLARKRQGKKTKQTIFKEIDKRLNKGLNKRQIAEEIAEKTGLSVSHIKNKIFPLYENWPGKK